MITSFNSASLLGGEGRREEEEELFGRGGREGSIGIEREGEGEGGGEE